MPLVYSRDNNVLPKLSRWFNLSAAQLLSFLVVFVVLVIQLFREPVPLAREQESLGPAEPAAKADWFTPANTNIFHQPLPVSHPHKMTLLEEAKREAAEFDYSAEDVRKGVKAFISQMGMLKRRRVSSDSLELICCRRGATKDRNVHEPNTYICNRSTKWYGEGQVPKLP